MSSLAHKARYSNGQWLSIAIISGMLLLAGFSGLLIPFLPWWLVLGVVIVPTLFVAAARWPYFGLLVTLALVFEVVPAAFQPKVPIGGGQLKLYDLMIIYLTGVVALRALAARVSMWEQLGRYTLPLAYLFFCIGLSLFFVRYYAPNKMMLAEGRNFVGWLLVPLVLLGVDSAERYKYFVRGLIWFALLISAYVCIESVAGIHIMTEGRVEVLDKHGNSDITRSIAGGATYLITFALYYFVAAIWDRRLSTWTSALAILLLISALAVTFGRGVWIASAAGLIVSAKLQRGTKGVLKTALLAGLMISVMLCAAAVAKPRMAEALVERALGIRNEVESGGSFAWRKVENQEALRNIRDLPFTGVGIGGDYKQTISSRESFKNETTYIHNAYLFFPLKMGWHAFFIPLLWMWAFAKTARRAFATPGTNRGFLAAVCGAFVVPVITSFTQPEWVALQSVAAVTMLLVLPELHRRFSNDSGDVVA